MISWSSRKILGQKAIVLLGFCCGLALLAPGLAAGQTATAAGKAVDLAQLDLHVADARVLATLPLDKAALKPEAGMKWVAVTLRGHLAAPGRVEVKPDVFTAFYSEQLGSATQERLGKSTAKAVGLGGEGTWETSAAADYPKARDVLIDAALPVPTGCDDFYILYKTGKGIQRARVQVKKAPAR
jgi:hypothetical protein